MIQSILDSVKKVLSIDPSYTAFDEDILMHVNSVFSTLTQLGVGPDNGFMIEDKVATWSDFIPGFDPRFSMVKSYMVLRVRLLFDPPATSFAIESMQKQIDQLEWRINVEREYQKYPTPPTPEEGQTVWTLSLGDPWPAEAVPGDLGFDPNTGDVWRFI